MVLKGLSFLLEGYLFYLVLFFNGRSVSREILGKHTQVSGFLSAAITASNVFLEIKTLQTIILLTGGIQLL